MMSTKQNRTLLVLKYLWEETDIEHPATIKDIIAYLEKNGISSTRKTIVSDIEDLQSIGIDIDCERKTQNQYFIDVRTFELPEVKLLVDAVQSSRFITASKSKKLIKKLSGFVGRHQSKELHRQLYVDNRIKAGNESVYYTVDNIHTAIQQKKRVLFQYQEYTPDKKKVLKHDGYVYELSPYALVWNDDCYYVIGYSEKHQKIAKFRVDRMVGLEPIEEVSRSKPNDFDVSDYFSQIFSMYDGKECDVVLLCENALMKNIIDKFGENVVTECVDENTFSAKIKVSLSPTFYGWVFSFAGRMKIVSPNEAIIEFKNMLKYNE